MGGFREAMGFLTRIPMRSDGPPGPAASPWFPVVGALVGLWASVFYVAAYQLMPSPLAALFAVVAGTLVTGAFHEDGLADSADALGSGASGERGLEIMRDSKLGTYGSIAVIVTMLTRVLAVAALTPVQAVAGLVMAHSFGRAAAVVLMKISRPARPDGLGRAGVVGVSVAGAWIAVLVALVIGVVAGGWWVVPGAALAAISVLWLGRISTRRFGGVTGDILGACEQLVEMAVLVATVVMSWQGLNPWWATS